MPPTVSVIIPTYDRCDLLPKTVDSVLAQDFRDFELIIVDDGSTDGTSACLAEYHDERITIIEQSHRGVSAARNKGLEIAAGEYIAFCDSDDWWRPYKLTRQVTFMRSRSEYVISHTEEIWYRYGKFLNQMVKHKKRAGDIFEQSLDLCAIGMSTVMLNREVFDAVGGFDESYPVCEDYELWLRVTSRYLVGLLDEKLTLKDGGRPDQLTQRYRFLDQYRLRAIVKLLKTGELTSAQEMLAKVALAKKGRIYYNGCLKHQRLTEAAGVRSLLKPYCDMEIMHETA